MDAIIVFVAGFILLFGIFLVPYVALSISFAIARRLEETPVRRLLLCLSTLVMLVLLAGLDLALTLGLLWLFHPASTAKAFLPIGLIAGFFIGPQFVAYLLRREDKKMDKRSS